jgi:hypothetical protein
VRKGKPNKIDWEKFKTSRFEFPPNIPPHISPECGAYALYALTGKQTEDYRKIFKKLARKDGHWSTKTMVGYLNSKGFVVIPITIGNVVESYSVKQLNKPWIESENVILLDQKCYREENTWSVIHGNMYAHSGDVDVLDPLEFLNYPIEAAYLVYHPKWNPRRKERKSL